MKKIIAIDLDGTLLNSCGEISDENRAAIRKSKEQGARVILASGRMPSSVKNFAIDLQSDRYIICGNGTSIYDLEKDETIYENYMDKEKALEIIKVCEENSIFYSVYTENAIISKSLNYNVLVYYSENANKEESKKTNINIVENVYEYIDKINTKNILKINVCDSNKIIFEGMLRKIREISDINLLEISNMTRRVVKNGTEEFTLEYFYTEISNENVNKWTAIQKLSEILQIEQKDIIAIGDNINDKMMIENAGTGIVMGNGSLALQTQKGNIVSDNNQNGVAEGIEKYYLRYCKNITKILQKNDI